MKNSEALDHVRSLTDKQFAEFFYHSVANRPYSDVPEYLGHFVLAGVDKVEGEAWGIATIAMPDSQEYPGGWDDDSPLCQFGTCEVCNLEVCSVAKHAICPVCDAKVYCT